MASSDVSQAVADLLRSRGFEQKRGRWIETEAGMRRRLHQRLSVTVARSVLQTAAQSQWYARSGLPMKVYLTLTGLSVPSGETSLHIAALRVRTLTTFLLSSGEEDHHFGTHERRVRSAMEKLSAGGLLARLHTAGHTGVYGVLPQPGPKFYVPRELWRNGWLQAWDGATLGLYLLLASRIGTSPSPGRRPRVGRFEPESSLPAQLGLSARTVFQASKRLEEDRVIHTSLKGGRKYLLLTNADLVNYPPTRAPRAAQD